MNRSAAISVTVITALLLIAVAVLAALLGVYVKDNGSYARAVNSEYTQAYYQLKDSFTNVQSNLSKARVVRGREMLSELMLDTAVCCESAGDALYKFAYSGYSTAAMTKYANQVADYCSYIHNKAVSGDKITDTDYSTLNKLSDVAAKLQEMLGGIGDDITNFRFSEGLDKISDEFSGIMSDIQDGSIEYPSLIYDGPFSDGLDEREAKGVTGEDISIEQGAEKVRQMLSDMNVTQVDFVAENTYHFPTYLYSFKTDKGDGDAQITKRGGHLVLLSHNCSGEKTTDSVRAKAEEFVARLGLKNMKAVWEAEGEGLAYVNLCLEEDGAIIYPDMVKVKISTETGCVVGYEALSYLYNHTDRAASMPAISEEEALSADLGELEPDGIRLAIIPTEGGGERLAYEIYGTVNDLAFFVYIDAETGREVKVMQVIDSDQGKLLL